LVIPAAFGGKSFMRVHTRLLRLAVLPAFAGLALAQVPAITGFTGATAFGSINSTAQTIGFTFTANSNLIVSALGFWEQNTGANLMQTHDVGLWSSSGTLLASGTVAVNSPVTGNWRYVTISPITLTAGQTYTVGSAITSPFTDTFSRVDVPGGTITSSPLIAVTASAVNASGGGFSFPSIADPIAVARLGPNLMVQAAPPTVPPPTAVPISPVALIAIGAGLALLAALAMGILPAHSL
jgi:hypothetical protein